MSRISTTKTGIYSSTVSRAMMSSANTPSLKSVPFFVEVPPCTETSAAEPFLVHSQSSYDEQRQYAVSSLCRSSSKSSTAQEISAAEPFYRPRSVER
ncbi:hypothetical protein EVAR_100523_1 [Eumeta japonica]|uniref:Uncharacterized protein n=1 Tax=Eumeta variegata TaxID=151549 RepID=A0A4C2AAY1_EUMVA|nr:hypothetical protein EVAR_100523_1 [Eumeta japonica]